MKTVASFALGCKVNQYESEAIAELFKNNGYNIVEIDNFADIYIINTCTVTNFGDKKSRQLIRKVKRQNPDAFVAVAGCYAQTAPDEIAAIEGVNLIIGTNGKNNIVSLVEDAIEKGEKKVLVNEIMKERTFEELKVTSLEDRTRAYIKIQDGCDRFCSYCIIPYARGPVRSRRLDDIVSEVKSVSANGFKEVVLTGIHVASYGKDLGGITLLDAIKAVNENEKIKRIRLSSVEPNIVTEYFMKEISSMPKVCDHFHLSLQSGCDKTLKEMNRRYTAAEYKNAVDIIRKYMPSAALTTDIIVGFPGETEEDFKESCDFAKKIGFLKIHVFPYSPKRGTVAAERKDKIRNDVKAERSKRLIAISDETGAEFIDSFIGRTTEVLFEREEAKNTYGGHTSNFIRVRVKSERDIENMLLTVKITGRDGEEALGELI